MTIRGDIDDIIGRELDDCERALKRGDADKAMRELRDAVSKLKDIESKVNRLEIAARKARNV
jgi:hypothetical protein